MHELLKTLLPSGTPCACCACDDFADNGRANITADYILFFQINVLTCGFFLLSAVQLAWFHNYCVHLVHFQTYHLGIFHLSNLDDTSSDILSW